MERNRVMRIFESKVYPAKNYVETYRTDDEKEVYKMFSAQMRAKFIFKVPYIKKVVRRPLYNGFDEIVFYQDFNGKKFRETFIIRA